MGYKMDFIENINKLPRANITHVMTRLHFKGSYNFHIACTDYLQKYYMQILHIKRSWNFTNPSTWFLTSIKDYIEFVPELLESLQPRSVLPFIQSFRYTGTYYGFQLLCIGIFGKDVIVEYRSPDDGLAGTPNPNDPDLVPYPTVDVLTINIDGISSPINYKILGEGEQDFYLTTEDMKYYLITEDVFVPPSGLWTIEKILRQNLPAGVAEIVEINFIN